MRTPKPPPPPDPYALADAQTRAAREAAAYNNAMNAGSVFTPLGSSVFTPRVDPVTGATVYDQTISLSPEQEDIYRRQLAQDRQLTDIGTGMLGRIGQAYGSPVDLTGMPERPTQLAFERLPSGAMPTYQTGLDVQGPALRGTVGINEPLPTAAPTGALSTEGLPNLFGADDLLNARQQVQDALYRQQAAYLDPQWQQREEQMRTRLANQGVVEGSEAWRNAIDDYNRARTFDYDQARRSAIAGGLNEMTGLARLALGNRGQLFGERLSGAELANQAASINNAFNLARRQQAWDEATGGAEFQNRARAQALAEALTGGQFGNEARSRQFQDLMAMNAFNNALASQQAEYQNAARDAALREALTLRALPFNELASLRNATQIDVPQFSGMNVSQTTPTDVAGLVGQNYQNQLNIWNARMQARNALLQGLMGLGGQLYQFR